MNNVNRYGRFTSSQNYRAMATLKSGLPAQPFHTYVEEKAVERIMKRKAETKVSVRATLWGNLMEIVLFNLLGLDYKMVHKETVVHKKHWFWSGSPDLKHTNKVGEIKCYEPKNFGLLSMCLNKRDISMLRENFQKEYWQCVSNACLLEVKKAELIAYMPYRSELLEIIKEVQETNFLERNGLNPTDYVFWFNDENIESLPYLPDDSGMSNINSFEFTISDEDMNGIESRLVMANEEVEKITKNQKK